MNTSNNAESVAARNSVETSTEIRVTVSPQNSNPPLTAEEQQHSLVIFTRRQGQGAFRVEIILPNVPPVGSFVVKWEFPQLLGEGTLDPRRLHQVGRRPTPYTPETLLQALGDLRLSSNDWKRICTAEYGISNSKFFELLKRLREGGKVQKSVLDGKWEKICEQSRNPNLV
jgi:hypothetical protein